MGLCRFDWETHQIFIFILETLILLMAGRRSRKTSTHSGLQRQGDSPKLPIRSFHHIIGQPHFFFSLLLVICLLTSCGRKAKGPNPWGTDQSVVADTATSMSLDDIVRNGELIMVTFSGPDTYYEYRGARLGLHYLLCEKFCKSIGVALRVDVCRDTMDMLSRVERGEADLVAMPMKKDFPKLEDCGSEASEGKWHWLVNKENNTLAQAVDHWLTPQMIRTTDAEEAFYLSPQSITRHVYSPMQNRAKGIISEYDYLFQRYSSVAHWDWRLLAAQCYQESTFDACAHSWAGACGLMQIMPSTADHLHLSRADIYNPEKNVAAAARYIAELSSLFSDVDNASERIKFVLASYNGGNHHIRDAMTLTRKHGGNPHRWSDVRTYVLRLSSSAYYNDPDVHYGYMRGSETVAYVDRIIDRWDYYRGVKATLSPPSYPSVSSPSESPAPPSNLNPHPSKKRKAKYSI